MNRFSFYIILILIFLGLSRGLPLNKKDLPYIPNENYLPHHFKEIPPFSVILVGTTTTGIIIKSYFHKYKIIFPNKRQQLLTVRVSKEFNQKNEDNIGMAIFQQNSKKENLLTPMPPGSVFIGSPTFGSWVTKRIHRSQQNANVIANGLSTANVSNVVNGGGNNNINNPNDIEEEENAKKIWRFHRSYQHLVKSAGLENFEISYAFHQKAQVFLSQGLAFHGLNDEFGTNRIVTKNFLSHSSLINQSDQVSSPIEFNDFIKKLLKIRSKWTTL